MKEEQCLKKTNHKTDSINSQTKTEENTSKYITLIGLDPFDIFFTHVARVDRTNYPELLSNYSFEESLEDYCDKLSKYSCEQKLRSQCKFYELCYKDRNGSKSILHPSSLSPIDSMHEELSLDLESFGLETCKQYILHELILEDLNIPKNVLDKLKEAQKERSALCSTFVNTRVDKVVSVHITYDLQNAEQYKSITNQMSKIIQEDYLSQHEEFNSQQKENIIKFLLHKFLLINAKYFSIFFKAVMSCPCSHSKK
ncbi:hypothetical protein AB837_00559 [bacterium AB1]|nr:hypothetical protein AB837_00559 [bacterium AB1]